MVYGIAYCPISRTTDLKDLGAADSKQLKEEDRDDILDKIHANKDYIGYSVSILSPNFISYSMLGRQNYNLNEMSHDTAISLLKRVLEKGVKVR